jgi:hypothetical protein
MGNPGRIRVIRLFGGLFDEWVLSEGQVHVVR